MGRMPHGPLRVAVLAGGASSERQVSLASGAEVAKALQAAGHGIEWVDPAATDLACLDWNRFDCCFLALHGGSGEDGRIQSQLGRLGVPYTGSGPAAARAAMSKSAAKALFLQSGVPTPDYVLLRPDDTQPHILAKVRRLGFPVVVKPDGQGSSLGVGIARFAGDLADRVADARRYDPLILAERFVAGREMTVAVLGRKALPLLEIVGREEIFDYKSKYSSTVVEYHFRTGLAPMKVRELEQTAVRAAAALGTSGLARVDLRLDGALRPWVLEVNTLPGMTDHSLAPMAAAHAGIDMPALCDWALGDALRRATGSRQLVIRQ